MKLLRIFVVATIFLSSVTFAAPDIADENISSYISSLNINQQKKNTLAEQLKVLQDILNIDLQSADEESVKSVGIRYMKVMSCLSSLYTLNGEDPEFMRMSRNVTLKILNTQEKDRHFHKFLAKIEKMNMSNWASQGTSNCGKN